MADRSIELAFRPVTPERFADLERLFGARGACAGCWCMWWRLPKGAFDAGKGEGNHRALQALVGGGKIPGLLAYEREEPVGWCCVGPRADFPRLASARSLKPVDDLPVWSVVCSFVARSHRRRGVSRALLGAAARWAAEHGAPALEGYPVIARQGSMPDAFAYTGLLSAFTAAGFSEVARPSATRRIVRRPLP